jgi:hypothetical protein
MSFLVNIMSIHQQEELNVVEGMHIIVLIPHAHMETSISHNGDKGVTNCIMGSNVFVAMNIT